MIDPAIWESEQVMSLESDLFKLYIYLINHADDEGRLTINIALIRSRCYPMHLDTITLVDVENSMQYLADIKLVWLYKIDGKTYLAHPNWKRYQSINKPTPSRIPPPPEHYDTTTVPLPDSYGSGTVGLPSNRREEKRREINRKEEGVRDDYGNPRWPKDSLELSTWLAFEKTYGNIMPDRERNRDAVDKIIFMAKERGDPERIIKGMMEKLLELKQADNSKSGFWRKQPFLPATLVSLWARVWEEAKIEAQENVEAEEVVF
jgi:hypothetical protein